MVQIDGITPPRRQCAPKKLVGIRAEQTRAHELNAHTPLDEKRHEDMEWSGTSHQELEPKTTQTTAEIEGVLLLPEITPEQRPIFAKTDRFTKHEALNAREEKKSHYILIGILSALVTTSLVAIASTAKIYKVAQALAGQSSDSPLVSTEETKDQRTLRANQDESVFSQIANIVRHDDEQGLGSGEDRVNILLLGIGGEGHPGALLTDTIIVVSIDTTSHRVGMLSIPRDLLVDVPELGYATKINSIYARTNEKTSENEGTAVLTTTIERITNLPIQYYVRADFEGFEQLIDALGGIEVTLEESIDDPLFPGPNSSYEHFVIDAGRQTLDGATALKVARSRYTTAGGDFGRARRQQLILEAIKMKSRFALEHWKIFTMNNALDIMSEHVRTNMSLTEMKALYDFSENISEEDITNVVLSNRDPLPALVSGSANLSGQRAYTLEPRIGRDNFMEVQFIARNIFEIDELLPLRERTIEEEPSVVIFAREENSEHAKRTASLLSHYGYHVTTETAPSTTLSETTTTLTRQTTSKPSSAELLEHLLGSPMTTTDTTLTSTTTTQDFSVTIKDDHSPSLTSSIWKP